MIRFALAGLVAAAISLAAPPAVAGAPGLPREAGQGAFAAIGEIVGLLRADPATDWSKIDIDALRRHLVDMDNVMIRARVTTTPVPGGARFDISGDSDAVRRSIQRMVTSHTAMADGEDGLHVVSAPDTLGATTTVTGPGDLAQAKIRALGFFGLLTGGVHHQLHHLMMARGRMHH